MLSNDKVTFFPLQLKETISLIAKLILMKEECFSFTINLRKPKLKKVNYSKFQFLKI